MTCKIDGCENMKWARGMCPSHYRRWRLDGDATARGPLGTKKGTLMPWLLSNVGYTGKDCLFWPFSRDLRGYGQIHVNGKRTGAHRAMCELAHGDGSGLEAAHECGNMACVNPNHLRWATRLENEDDKILHGTRPRGETSGSSKLKEHQVREIFSLKGSVRNRDIAARFNISLSAVERIHSGRSWGHLGLNRVIVQPAEEGLAA